MLEFLSLHVMLSILMLAIAIYITHLGKRKEYSPRWIIAIIYVMFGFLIIDSIKIDIANQKLDTVIELLQLEATN